MAASAVGKEWRGHVEQTKKHEEAIQAALPVTTTQLALIGTEVSGPINHRPVTRARTDNRSESGRPDRHTPPYLPPH
ncbi:unnamed protein product [Scytosiphon promiscuus]